MSDLFYGFNLIDGFCELGPKVEATAESEWIHFSICIKVRLHF